MQVAGPTHFPEAVLDPAISFEADRLARIAALESWHFWFVGRRALVRSLIEDHRLLGEPVLDVGCGTGSMLRSLPLSSRRVVGLDARPEGLQALRRTDRTARVVRGDGLRLPFTSGCFGAVLALDVAEHVDDHALLAEVRRVLRPGGTLVLTVPAGPHLWSARDELAGHLRRYTAGSLRSTLDEGGFDEVELGCYPRLLYPVVSASRARARRHPESLDAEEHLGPLANRLLTWITLAEVRLGLGRGAERGSSLFAVARARAA